MPATSKESADERLSLLVSQLDEFVVVLVDQHGFFTSWHPGVRKQLGYEADEFVGRHVDILIPEPERGAGVATKELEEAALHGSCSDTRPLLTKWGESILVEGVTIALRRDDGTLAGYGKVLRDVTEYKTHDANLRALARALDQTTVIIRQLNGTIEHWTTGCELLYGWTAEEAVGRTVQSVLKTVLPTAVDEIQAQLLATGTWKGELEQFRRDGICVYVSAHWVLLTDGDSEPVTVIETHSDITARLTIQKEVEQVNRRLKAMALELERSNQDLEEFARIASHDLSAPLTSTRWLVDLLASRHAAQLDDAGKTCLTQIRQGLDRMSDLVDAVLTHARVGTSAIGTAEPNSTAAAVDASLDNLRHHIVQAGAVIHCRTLPAVSVEAQALTQLFQNLISNAIKYRTPGVAPQIQIDAEWREGMWLFNVSDNGIGIEPEWHDRIFQPMQRRHGLDVAGSGIGLATCKKIVTRAGGRIWVESQPGKGATFYFTLPGPPPE